MGGGNAGLAVAAQLRRAGQDSIAVIEPSDTHHCQPLSTLVGGGFPNQQESGENTMCRAVTCKTCGKTAWAGCGQHVDQVMSGIPAPQRCPGHKNQSAASVGFLHRLFGRR